jgi:hypothetical protein
MRPTSELSHPSSGVPVKPIPWLFGRGGCDRALICLAINGPLTVRELGRATGIDAHKTWNIVERLRLCGLVVKREVSGARKYVSINRRLPIYRALMKLRLTLDWNWPATRYRNYIARWRMPFDSEMNTRRLDEIFQSTVRSRSLLFVAASGETNLKSIYTILGLTMTSVCLAVNHWEKQGVLRSRRFKRHRLTSLDPRFIVAKELRGLLRAIVAASPEHDALRAASRTKQRTFLKAAGANIHIPQRVARNKTR